MSQNSATNRETPQLLVSVVIPTYNRIPQLVNLLQGLAGQSVAPDLFEVIVSDDGSTDPVQQTLEERSFPYNLIYVKNDNAGPAAARNRGIEQARGLLTLILNDDAVPADDLISVHLNAHARQKNALAVLGSFSFVEESLARPFVRLVEDHDLMFDFGSMRPGCLYGWQYFWTCNISVPTRALLEVCGFDERFRDPMCEDVEIGYRLGMLGIPVLYLPDAVCRHDHDMDPDRFVKRARSLGRNLLQMCDIHPTPEILGAYKLGGLNAAFVIESRKSLERTRQRAAADLETLRTFDQAPLPEDPAQRDDLVERMHPPARRLANYHSIAGIVEEWIRRNGDPEKHHQWIAMQKAEQSLRIEDSSGGRVSIIMPCIDGLDHTRRCLDSIAAHTPEAHEVIVVDNGSREETLQRLRARDDIRLLEMGENIGAPAARNRGLEVATGHDVVFLDNDTRVTPGWLSGFAVHAGDPRVGLVGPMSNTVSGSQLVQDPAYDPDELDAYAGRFARQRRGRHHDVHRLILFCLYVRRPVLDSIGGFDPGFGRWGFEDDDFCLRAALAGYRMRVAEDVFIHHTGSQTSKEARIDYSALLRDNWEVFKRKWQLQPSLPYGTPYSLYGILREPFDPARHRVQIGREGSAPATGHPEVVPPHTEPRTAVDQEVR